MFQAWCSTGSLNMRGCVLTSSTILFFHQRIHLTDTTGVKRVGLLSLIDSNNSFGIFHFWRNRIFKIHSHWAFRFRFAYWWFFCLKLQTDYVVSHVDYWLDLFEKNICYIAQPWVLFVLVIVPVLTLGRGRNKTEMQLPIHTVRKNRSFSHENNRT